MKLHFSIIGHGEAASEVEFVEWLQDMINEYNTPIPKFETEDKLSDESTYYFLNSHRIGKRKVEEAEPDYNTKLHHIRVTKSGIRDFNNHLADATLGGQFSHRVKPPILNFYHVLVREDVIQD